MSVLMTVEYGWVSGQLVSWIKVVCCKAVAVVMGGWWVCLSSSGDS